MEGYKAFKKGCRDCKFHQNGSWCEFTNTHTPDEFFCCKAERNEMNNEQIY